MPLGIAADSTTIDMGNTTTTYNNGSNKNSNNDNNSNINSNSNYEYDPTSKLGMKLREQQIARQIYRPAAVSKHSNVSIADLIVQDNSRFKKFR